MAAEVRERGRRAVAMPGDIRDFSEQLAAAAVEQLGRLDVWVSNAGGSEEKRTQPLVETSDDTWRAQLELNLTTVFQGAAAACAAHDGGRGDHQHLLGRRHAGRTQHRALRRGQGRA